MTCTNCKKIETLNPNGICGFCSLQDTLAGYIHSDKIREAILNMPKDEMSLDKQALVDNDRTHKDYADMEAL